MKEDLSPQKKSLKLCQPIRLHKFETLLKECGGEVLLPPFYKRQHKYIVAVPDKNAQRCAEAVSREFPSARTKVSPWESAHWKPPTGGKDGKFRYSPSVVFDENGNPTKSSIPVLPGVVTVHFKRQITDSTVEEAKAVIRKYGGYPDRGPGRFDYGAIVPEGCEFAFIKSVIRDPLVSDAHPEMEIGPQ